MGGSDLLHAEDKPVFKPDPSKWNANEISLAWIGHSTILLNFYGTIILTDPVLFERVGVYFLGSTFGPGRFTRPALFYEELPKPDVILLSHGHMDHTDYQTLLKLTKKFSGKINCITAYNTKDITSDLEWKKQAELDWGQSMQCADVNFTALEVKHFGWRYPGERDRSRGFFKNGRSFNGYLLEKNGKKIIFGGDTAFSDKFKKANIGDVDIAIMPVGAYNPWHMVHCNPEESLSMALDMKAKYFIPIHCKTFHQGIEPADEPIKRLSAAIKNTECTLGLKEIGETFILKHKI